MTYRHSNRLSQPEPKDLSLPEPSQLRPIVQVLLFEHSTTSQSKNVAQSLLEDVLGLKLFTNSFPVFPSPTSENNTSIPSAADSSTTQHTQHTQQQTPHTKVYRCQVEFTGDHLKEWNLLLLGETYQFNVKQSVIFQFEVLDSQQEHNLQYNDYDGCLVVLTPGITVETFEGTFLKQMQLTPRVIVNRNIHFLNTCPPASLFNEIDQDDIPVFDVNKLSDDIRPFIHSLFPTEMSQQQQEENSCQYLNVNSLSPNTRSPLDRTSYAVHKLFQSDDVAMLMNVFRDVITRLLLEIYKFDIFRVGSERQGYSETLLRGRYIHSQLKSLLAADHSNFNNTMLNLNKHFILNQNCLVQLATNMEAQFDPVKIWSKLGWEQLNYDAQLALVQSYLKEHVFKLNSKEGSDTITVFLTEESVKHYTKKKLMKHKYPVLSLLIKNAKFGKRGYPTYKAPTYYIDHTHALVVVEVWTMEYRKDYDEVPDVTYYHMKYSFPCTGLRMQVTEMARFKNTNQSGGLFACVL
jgi:hypothetical protein